ncbi:Ku DNA-binding complex, Ku70 subunit [Tuber magnatum]|uniref:ATP-dependent DNA helicase II subunit 1 n=1 Tax=Tuber magnatum TaxID=42249 RepID=A0A317SE48_9PEZI|nr:Ku DNA-binding complex, Ku70 subunit [Tuber magnatum]
MLAPQELDDDGGQGRKKGSTPASAVLTALQCAYGVLQSRIISNPNDMMGILFFGTEATKFDTAGGGGTGGGYEHCYLLLDLDIPDAEGIKGLKGIIEDPEEFGSLLKPAKEQVSMANVLFAVNQIFTTKAANFQSRRLFIVTDEDDPHSTDKALKNSSITRARDLYDLGVRIDPFFIYNPAKGGFDSSKFYDDIVYRSPTDEEDDSQTAVSGRIRLKQMVSSIKSKSTPKRALFTNKLELGPGLVIGVKGYLLFKRQEKARSHYVYTSGEKAKIVKGVTTQLAEETAKVVDKAEIRKAYKFGGEQILFTPEEMKAMRNFGEPVIRIIGFKPASAVRFDMNVKPANFIYSDETGYVGSTRVFAALHAKLVRDEKVGIAWCIPRKNAAPQIVAILPSVEELGDDGVQIIPPGFFLIYLPFADDVRQNPENKLVRAPAALIDRMRAVVKQLHMPRGYVPDKYSNPSLQWHYRILQAIALDEDMPAQPTDTTLPKYKLIDKHAGTYCREWGEELEKLARNLATPAAKTSAAKRSTLVKGEGVPRKKVKAEDGGEGDEVMAAWRGGGVARLTVAKLRAWLEGRGLDTSGRKVDLVERVEGVLDG